MTDDELAAIRKRADAATPGPWRWNSYSGIMAVVPTSHALAVPDDIDSDGKSIAWVAWIDGGPRQHEIGGDELHTHEARNDALFIEHSRNDVPALLAEVERLRAVMQDEYVVGQAFVYRINGLEAENAALREIVQAVAALSPNGNDLCFCYHHDESRNFAGQMEEWIAMGRPHKPSCVYAKTRALLAGEQEATQQPADAADAGTGTDEEDAPLDWRDALERWGLEQARRRMRWDPVRGYVFDQEA